MTGYFNRRKFIRTGALAGIGAGIITSAVAMPAFKQQPPKKGLRIGIIGLDTSHSITFTKIFNDTTAGDDLGGFKVVAAFPKGSSDIESSVSRIPAITKEIQELGVEIVASIEDLINKSDVILLETNDGRLHLEQALPVLKSGKRLFIDKPVAATLPEVISVFNAVKKHGTQIFSSSALRYFDNLADVREDKTGKVIGADTFTPATLEKTHTDLFWYGIHGVEMLFTVMGTGCKKVSRTFTEGSEIVTGVWSDNRIGTFRGIRAGEKGYGGTVFGEKQILTINIGKDYGYRALMVKVAGFFETGIPPVTSAETLEIYTFMAAAQESSQNGGVMIDLETTLQKARKDNTFLNSLYRL